MGGAAAILGALFAIAASRAFPPWLGWIAVGAGAPLYDFRAVYTLAELEGKLRVTAIAHNEQTHSRTR